ncbi:MAG: mechanosensitive ion channel family protein [Erysipelotrichaceae bacterium]|nr:mechanosensitive ion channel family protein [Erysipelotrichaceae bacterium]
MFEINWPEIIEALKINTTNLIVYAVSILFVLIIARLALVYLSAFTNRMIAKAEKLDDEYKRKELITSMTLLRSVGRYAIYFIAICVIVNHLGYGSVLSNVVTAAGVGALIVSLGAQSVIKDVIAGAFIMFERQYAVGDYVKINDYEGTVTSLAMRCTYLKTWKGEKIIIPNGSINTVVNYSGDFNMAVVDIPTPYEEDTERVLKIIREVADAYYNEHQDICYDVPTVAAINSFAESSVIISIYQKAVKRNHYQIQRDLKMAIKKRFDKEGISIPYNQIVVHEGDKQKEDE